MLHTYITISVSTLVWLPWKSLLLSTHHISSQASVVMDNYTQQGCVNNTNIKVDSSSFAMNTYIEPLVGFYYLFFIEKIFRKHRYSLEPVHLLVINIMMDVCLDSFAKSVENILFIFIPESRISFCKYTYFFRYYCAFCFYTDLILEQVDRFLALFWNVKYKTRVTYGKTVKTIRLSKLVLISLALLVISLDEEATRCDYHDRTWACRYLRKNNIFYYTIPMFITVFIIIMVSVYFMVITHRVSTRISPFTIPLRNLEAAQLQQAAIHQSSEQPQEPVNDNEIMEIQDIEDANSEETNQVDNSVQPIQRQNPDPYMFYRVKDDEKDGQTPSVNQPNNEEVLRQQPAPMPILAKEVLKINFVILFLVLLMCPINVFNIIFYVNDTLNCQTLGYTSKIFGFVQLLFVILYPFLLLAKVKMI